jgi:UDP-glucose 4-epimerase
LKSFSEIKIRILDNLSIGTRESLAGVCNFAEVNISHLASNNPLLFTPNSSSSPQVELVVGDIRERNVCITACKDIDVVIHLAAHAGVLPSIEDPFYDFEVNIRGTLNLLNGAVKNKVKRFIFASSNAPMGNQEPPMSEKKVPKPLSPYGASKLSGEAYCSAFYGSYGLETVVLRFSNAFGSYSLHKNSVIAKFIKDSLTQGILTVYGDGRQTRDFIHVNDICEAIALCTWHHDIGGEVFQLATGKETSIINLAEGIKGISGNNIQIEFKPPRRGEIGRNYADITKIKKHLGFSPIITLEQGLKMTFEWFRNLPQEILKREEGVRSGSD